MEKERGGGGREGGVGERERESAGPKEAVGACRDTAAPNHGLNLT